MSTIGLRLFQLRKAANLSQKELAERAGLRQSAISTVENTDREISATNLYKLSQALNVSITRFFEDDENSDILLSERRYKDFAGLTLEEFNMLRGIARHFKELRSKEGGFRVHVAGAAAAGHPLYDEADPDVSIEDVPEKYRDSSRFLIIQARGDSMEPGIPNGSYVVVERDTQPSQGEVAVVRVSSDGSDEYTIKHFYRHGDDVELRSDNSEYPPMFFPLSEVQSAERVVAYLSSPLL